MIVTAEPYFAVNQPGNTVVLENVFGPATLGKVENIDASYELVGRGIYSPPTPKSKTPSLASTARPRLNFLKRATPCASRTSPCRQICRSHAR